MPQIFANLETYKDLILFYLHNFDHLHFLFLITLIRFKISLLNTWRYKLKKLGQKFIQEQHECLLRHKTKILNSKYEEVTSMPIAINDQNIDSGDLAQTYVNQDVAIGLQEKNLKILREIELALNKIQNGTYGICEESEEIISMDRLRKVPWARYTVEIAEEFERENYLKVA